MNERHETQEKLAANVKTEKTEKPQSQVIFLAVLHRVALMTHRE